MITTIKTVSEFATAIAEFPIMPGCSRFFRGHAIWEKYLLEPSINRKKNRNILLNEEKAIRDAIVRCPNDFPDSMPFFEILVKLQHYGLPTRLLDVTTNALVALYFACQDHERTEGEVIILDIPDEHIKFYSSDTVAVIANISRRDSSFDLSKLPADRDEFNKDGEIGRLVYDIQEYKSAFTPQIVPEDLRRILAVRTKLDNSRIVRQDGAFLIFGINPTKQACAKIPSDWIVCGNTQNRIIFSSKHILKRELLSFGISKQVLFPELDSQTKAIVDKYNKKYERK